MSAKKKIRISVILPVYNCEKYLRYAIESILGQTFGDFELLLLDDGSTDRSSRIANEYASKDARIRYFYHQNIGLTKTLNIGLSLSRGDYISRQDADDLSHPNRLEKQVKYLCEHPDVSLVGSSMYQINEKGEKMGSYIYPACHDELVRWMKKGRNPFPHTSIMFRKDVVKNKIGGYRDIFKKSQDVDLYLRVCEKFNIASIQDNLVYVRVHPESISRDSKFYESRMYALYALACYQFRKKYNKDPYGAASLVEFRKRYMKSSHYNYVILRHKYQKKRYFVTSDFFRMVFLKLITAVQVRYVYKWLYNSCYR
ncbi:glycosyltransferase family 2 protein [Desulfovulcanus sp.]